MKPAVLNASPLIVLARAGYLDLLPDLFDPVVIPRAVINEIIVGPADDSAVTFLSRTGWIRVVDLAPALPALPIWPLGQGESEVLEYAQRNPGTVAILDDKAARRVAETINVERTGTLGLLVAAARKGLLPSLAQAIDVVRQCGLYIDREIES